MFLWGAALIAIAPLVADCGGGGDDDDDNGASLNPCATVYQAQCGVTCSDAAPCATGLFCSNGACTAQCTSEGGCSGGQVCTTNGRCVSNGGSAGGPPIGPGLSGSGGSGSGGSGGVSGAGGGGDCPDVSVKFQPIIPAVMLVIDRSASMNCYGTDEAEVQPDCPDHTNPNDPLSRWQLLKGPLLNVVQNLEKSVIFGATFYTTGGQCNVELDTEKFRIENSDEIKARYDALLPEGNTPTSQAVTNAADTTNAPASELPPGTPKFMILATDGSPNCAGEGANAHEATVGAIEATFASGVKTFVVAIGALFEGNSPIEVERRERFQELADAGAGVAAGAPPAAIYFASDSGKLESALTTIINGERPCSFDLDVALTNPSADGPKGVVTIDDGPIPFNTPDGWRLADNDTIEFIGAACGAIQGGSTNVKASFPCGVQTTPAPPKPPLPR